MKNFPKTVCTGWVLLLMIVSSCKPSTQETQPVDHNSLSSWNDGAQKQRILDFIKEVTNEDSKGYVPPKDRLAVFDFDGTVGCEKPDYMEVIVAMKQLCKKATEDPSLLKKDSIYVAACANDYAYINKHVYAAILEAFLEYNQDRYIDSVAATTSKEVHPRFEQPYRLMYYKPMFELINLLKAQDFTVYLVSRSEEGFLRAYGEDYLDIDSHKIIGSTISLSYQYNEQENSSLFLRDSAYLQPMAGGAGKAELIKNRIGKQPILAFGNTMGDYQMLTYAQSNSYPNLSLILIHDDPREYIYYDKTLQQKAQQHNWVSVKMKEDFKVVFPF
jgi:hypothetical protein